EDVDSPLRQLVCDPLRLHPPPLAEPGVLAPRVPRLLARRLPVANDVQLHSHSATPCGSAGARHSRLAGICGASPPRALDVAGVPTASLARLPGARKLHRRAPGGPRL